MTYEEKINSEIYAVLKILGKKYIEKVSSQQYSYIVANKSQEYNPVYIKDKPLSEQIEDQEILNTIEVYIYANLFDANEQDKFLTTLVKSETNRFDDSFNMLIWSETLPEVQSKHMDFLIKFLPNNIKTQINKEEDIHNNSEDMLSEREEKNQHKENIAELLKCIPKSERKNYIDRIK